ncbi:MAG: gliding motility-associated C-terminal domain-containing protein [Burkholderiales bacterium]|nr:gliding motility-associated C-terminal domain-containing protein [Bacteroidia bacterium]
MKKKLFSIAVLIIFFIPVAFAQNNKKVDQSQFDEKAAYTYAKAKGIKPTEISGYVQFLKNDFSSKKALEKQAHKHTPYESGSTDIQETVIYLEPNKPMSLGCPNMGFEQYNFNGWTGGTGTTSIGAVGGSPVYNSTGLSIVNPAGNNVTTTNTANYHTIMTLPAINPVSPTFNGYDKNTCRAVGTQTISEIPFVSPFSFDPVSVRMNGELANYRACRLKYITSTSSTNQRLSFSYAVVLQNGGHLAEESPYFKVEVRNEATGAILPGCTSYTFNPVSSLPSDSLKTSVTGPPSGIGSIQYRKWQYYSVDLSTLPSGTNVSINFEVGGCTQSGHWGYAYVDAECGGIGTPYANMCSGSNFATLVAPTGFTSYQWSGPSGLISGATNDTLIAGPTPSVTAGDIYTVSMISPGGCPLSQTVSINLTTVSIINLNANSSCAGGNSGSASVVANGSNGVYTYTWTNTTVGDPNFGLAVSTSQTATGLSPGTYSVLVASTTCGQASANLSVGVSPPFFNSLIKPFCGNATAIAQPGGSNYVWYHGTVLVPAPNGNNDTLYINPAVASDVYTVVYKNSQGCRDSIQYTLNQVSGGSTYFSNVTNVCPNNSNGTTVLNLNTPFSAPYSYIITGPTAANTVSNTTTTATSLTITALAPGTYSAVINDGTCIYNNTVTIGTIQTNFTVTPTNTVLCFPDAATLNLDFGNIPPTSCGLDPSLCSGSATQLFNTGPFLNNTGSNYPTPFSGWWYSGKHQFLVKAAELNAVGITAGKISSLAFKITALNTSPLVYPDYQIKMGCTSLMNLPTGSNQPFITGLNTVYFNPNQSISLGWVTHSFSQSYTWDGVSNIIIEVCTGGLTSFPDNASIELKQMPYIANMKSISYNSGVSSCPDVNANQQGGYMTNGANMLPNMRFGFCSASQSPSDYTVSVSPNGTITTNYSNDSIRVAPTTTVPPTGTGSVIYTVTVINPTGACVATHTVEILYPPLTTTISTAITNTALCEGGSTTLSATGAANYNWYYYQSGGLTPISTSPTITLVPPAIGTNTYVVTGTAPCPSSTPDTKTITVNVTPKANLFVTPLVDLTKCLNKSFVFSTGVGSSTPGNSGTPYTYSWTTLPGNNPATGVNTTTSYTASSNTTETLVVTVNGVCANPTADTVVVKNYVDDLSIAITNSFITCPNKPLTLNSITTGGHAVYNYSWTVNSAPVGTSPSLNYTSPLSGGTYTVGITVIDSCGYQKFDSEVIVVLPNTLNIDILDSVTACGNTQFTLTSLASGGYPSYTYLWTMNSDVLSTNQILTSITPPNEGAYTIFVTASDSCGYQSSDFEVINVLPPCSVIIPNIITPNGDNANEYFKITNLEYHPNTSIVIFDRWGRKVYENSNYNNEWKADGNSDGTYFYVIDVPDDKKYSGFVTVFKGK